MTQSDISSKYSHLPKFRVAPVKKWSLLELQELWAYRELFFFMVWRDIKVQYKQTIMGASWAIIQPFMTMVVFSLFFGKLAQMPSDDIPYPLFSYSALVPWTFFATGVSNAANSLVGNSNLLKKVYFPRIIIPTSTILARGIDFLLAFLVLLGMMAYYEMQYPQSISFSINIFFLPFFLLIALITALGIGLWLAAMNVQFRDVRFTVPFIIQLWLFITPIAYPSSLITNELVRVLYGLNPMAGVVEGFRWALLSTNTAPALMIMLSTLVAVILCFSGLLYFKRMEDTFADIV